MGFVMDSKTGRLTLWRFSLTSPGNPQDCTPGLAHCFAQSRSFKTSCRINPGPTWWTPTTPPRLL